MSPPTHELDDSIPAPRAPLPIAVDDFIASMPASYHTQFSETEARDHATIVWRRSDTAVHIEQWQAPDTGATWLCVVTDDRPGLLALLSAAITAHSLNIVDAKIYSHAGHAEQNEAVDFFRVSSIKSTGNVVLSAAELAALKNTVVGVLRGSIGLSTLKNRSLPTWRPTQRPETSVYFDGEGSNGAHRLIVETADQPGLLAAITTALFNVSVSIEGSDVVTLAGMIRDEFHLLGQDGNPLEPEHKEIVVAQVRSALDLLAPEDVQPSASAPSDDDFDDDPRLSQIQMAEPDPVAPARRFSKAPNQM